GVSSCFPWACPAQSRGVLGVRTRARLGLAPALGRSEMGFSFVDGTATIPITRRFRERARRTNRLDLRGEGPGRRSRFPCVTRRDLHVARIAGVNIPTNKRVVVALQYIHGIG